MHCRQILPTSQHHVVCQQQKGNSGLSLTVISCTALLIKLFCCLPKQVIKLPFQKISHRSFEGNPTTSVLELLPSSPLLKEIYLNPAPFTNIVTVSCEITIFHSYHKNLLSRITLLEMSSTVPPHIYDRYPGNPDNSPLTGASSYAHKNGNLMFLLAISLNSYLLFNIPVRMLSM